MLSWAHIGQASIHHLTSGSFTSNSKERDNQSRETPKEGLGRDDGWIQGGTLTVVNSQLPHRFDLAAHGIALVHDIVVATHGIALALAKTCTYCSWHALVLALA
jgi:hypothetical protein